MKKILFMFLMIALIIPNAYAWRDSGWLETNVKVPHSATLPTGCSEGEIYYDTDATAGQQLYVCNSSGSWVLQGDGGGGSGGGWTDGGTNVYNTTTSDNVGIGTTTPNATLTVDNAGSSLDSFRVDDAAGGDGTPFVINNGGFVGIGTTVPASIFQVGTGASTNRFSITTGSAPTIALRSDNASTTDLLNIQGSGLSSGNVLDVSSSSAGQTVPLVSMTQSANSSGGTLSVSQSGTSSTGRAFTVSNLGTTDSLYVTDESSDSTPFVINASGSVGVGTTTPTGKADFRGDEVNVWTGAGTNNNAGSSGELYVEGDLEVDGTLHINSCSGAGCAASNAWTDGGSTIYPTTTTDSVGIGTTTPVANSILTIAGDNVQIGLGGSNAQATGAGELYIVGDLEVDGTIYGDGSALTGISSGGWTDGGTNVYLALTSDQVAIGTTTPTSGAALTVSGSIAGGTSGPLSITSANVGIGTFATPIVLLHVGNTAGSPGSVGANDVYIQNDLEVDGTSYLNIAQVTDDAYAAGWNGSSVVPTKNAVYDKIETLGASSGGWTDEGVVIHPSTTTDNVGIGTTTPSTTLEIVKQSSNKLLMLSSAATGDGDYLIVRSDGNVGIGTIEPVSKFQVGGSGNVGIGTYNPDARLQVNDVIKYNPTDSPTTCNAALEGGLYYDNSLNEFCDCDGSSWAQVDGGGAC